MGELAYILEQLTDLANKLQKEGETGARIAIGMVYFGAFAMCRNHIDEQTVHTIVSAAFAKKE